MRNTPVAIAQRLALMVAAFGLTFSAPAFGQDPLAPAFVYRADTTGHGAVLCGWSIILSARARTAACGLARLPIDDAIDEAVGAIDEFIIANSAQPPTREMLEEAKRRMTETDLDVVRRDPKTMCEHSVVVDLRKTDPEQFRAQIKWMLAIPREPVWNPCL